MAFNIKTQYFGRMFLKQIYPKLFPGLHSLFLLFGFIARFFIPESPSCICHTLATDPQILIALFLILLFSGCNFSFYIVTNCLAIILFSVFLLQPLSVFQSSMHWFSIIQFHLGFLKFIQSFPEPLLIVSNAVLFHDPVRACSSSQVILFPLLKSYGPLHYINLVQFLQ